MSLLKRVTEAVSPAALAANYEAGDWDETGAKREDIGLPPLTSLTKQTIPDEIDGDFDCSGNHLTDLKGSPKTIVTGNFLCQNNKLTSFTGITPKIDGSLIASKNRLGNGLKDIPPHIGRDLILLGNHITTLHNIHKKIQYVGRGIAIGANPITSCLLGLLLIDGVKSVSAISTSTDENMLQSIGSEELLNAVDILNKHLPNHIGMEAVFACQSDMIEAGLDAYAEL